MRQETPDLIDDVAWWQVPGQGPRAVLDWVAVHVSEAFTVGSEGGVHGASTESWELLPITGVLNSRWLVVTAVSDGAGGSDLRVEGQVTYTPARRASSYIMAASVHSVMVTAVPGTNDRTKPPAPLLITDPSTVGRLVSLVNGLPLFPPGTYACPFDDGRGVRLTFLSKGGASSGGEGSAASGPTLKTAVVAVAFASSRGCGGVSLTMAGTRTGLGWGPSPAGQALAISGMRWNLTEALP
jgi:hypothetical protein